MQWFMVVPPIPCRLLPMIAFPLPLPEIAPAVAALVVGQGPSSLFTMRQLSEARCRLIGAASPVLLALMEMCRPEMTIQSAYCSYPSPTPWMPPLLPDGAWYCTFSFGYAVIAR